MNSLNIINLFIFCILISHTDTYAQSNISNFNRTKEILETEIYTQIEPITLYCQATFDEDKVVNLPVGFETELYKNRLVFIEWEHVVPVENVGRTFKAWREGDSRCIDKHGTKYKGRRCAEKVSEEFRKMASDMHNIYPTIGAVNAIRSNYSFTLLPHAESDFGTCLMKIENNKCEPPPNARGQIARAYLYMEHMYPRYQMNAPQRKLMSAWDKQYPPTEEECKRAKLIETIQGNENMFIKNRCE